jgi:hypothetical protein
MKIRPTALSRRSADGYQPIYERQGRSSLGRRAVRPASIVQLIGTDQSPGLMKAFLAGRPSSERSSESAHPNLSKQLKQTGDTETAPCRCALAGLMIPFQFMPGSYVASSNGKKQQKLHVVKSLPPASRTQFPFSKPWFCGPFVQNNSGISSAQLTC